MAAMLAPSRAGDARFLRWFAKWQRASVSPRAAQAFLRAMAEVDVRPVLPLVQAPTLILHRRGSPTSSARPSGPPGWGIGAGGSCCMTPYRTHGPRSNTGSMRSMAARDRLHG
jgi:hypothetical protein